MHAVTEVALLVFKYVLMGHGLHTAPLRYVPAKQPREISTPVAEVKTPMRPPGLLPLMLGSLCNTHENVFAPFRKPLKTEKLLHALKPAFCATSTPLRDALHVLSQAHLPVTLATDASTTKKLVVIRV